MATNGKSKTVRLTFEDTLQYQEDMLELLDELVSKNRGLKDDKERKKYRSLLAHSTLGQGHKFPYEVTWKVKGRLDPVMLRWPSIYVFGMMLAYHRGGPITDAYNVKASLSFSQLWADLRRHLFRIWEKAQDRALAISPERAIEETLAHKYVGDSKPYDYQQKG